eukprot:TRINITY_DN2028_c0_g1_i2.p1 TRINITY_DN2028_c0_g1~~TRINITY_DN2028_c0_g1_i2.p1  ORF type:complete len:666 (+),score=193.61 TRINITY_DN2028_c0_g1_i2:40-1998(+)
MSFLDDLDSSFISSDLSTKSSKLDESDDQKKDRLNESFGGLEDSLYSSDLKSSSEVGPSESVKDEVSSSSLYLSEFESPFYTMANNSTRNPLWIEEEQLGLEARRKRYKAKSVTELKDIESWSSYSKRLTPKNQASPNFDVSEEINQKVSLWSGDITALELDAIVNAANESLLGGGGVDGAIHRAAGPKLLQECKTLHGCPTGETKTTRGYNLPAKYILHTVGPLDENPEKLESCYSTCLQQLLTHKIKSVAFCGVSTGIFGFPLEPASRIALKTVRQWLESEENRDAVDRIVFVNYLTKEKDCYERLMFEYFPVASAAQTAADNAAADNKAAEEAKIKQQEESDRQAQEQADRQAKEQADRQAKEQADRQAKEQADRQAKEEADRLVREEAERSAKEQADRQAKEEAERQAREAERAKEEAERAAKEQADRQAKEESERAARAEADRKAAQEERERQEREAVEKKRLEEETERLRREQEAINRQKVEKEESEKRAREVAEAAAAEEDRRKKEEARAKEEAERRKEQEEIARLRKLQAEEQKKSDEFNQKEQEQERKRADEKRRNEESVQQLQQELRKRPQVSKETPEEKAELSDESSTSMINWVGIGVAALAAAAVVYKFSRGSILLKTTSSDIILNSGPCAGASAFCCIP